MNQQLYNYLAQKEGRPLLQNSGDITYSVKTDNPAYLKIHEVWAAGTGGAESIGIRLLSQLIKQKTDFDHWNIDTVTATCVDEYRFNEEGQNEYEVVFNAKKVRRRPTFPTKRNRRKNKAD